jgi:Arc/MetJ-type ribon-helix-helix transcriptional regulator
MNSDELEHELEQLRLKIANLKYSLDGAYPDWAEYGRAHLREYEEQERDLLAQLDHLASKR